MRDAEDLCDYMENRCRTFVNMLNANDPKLQQLNADELALYYVGFFVCDDVGKIDPSDLDPGVAHFDALMRLAYGGTAWPGNRQN